MKANLSSDGKITISPTDSIDEYALGKWMDDNEVKSDKIIIETKIKKHEFGFKAKDEKSQQG